MIVKVEDIQTGKVSYFRYKPCNWGTAATASKYMLYDDLGRPVMWAPDQLQKIPRGNWLISSGRRYTLMPGSKKEINQFKR